MKISVIGAGLAGCEAAHQIARMGVPVRLFEMKPYKKTPAHKYDGYAELVCSNSLRADRIENAVGLLKEEMRRMGSLVIAAADASRVPAGGALAVNRKDFSDYITKAIRSNPMIEVVEQEINTIDQLEGIKIFATGPLTSKPLETDISSRFGEGMHFFDAAAPIISAQSVDMSIAFKASRWGKGGDDYINCPMTEEQYRAFYDALIEAECAELAEFEPQRVFEGCMPVEVMAARGYQTLCFGPLKPAGIADPKTGKWPFAVVQLRKEDEEGTMYNLVGFQTHLKFPEQRRVFRMIPGLGNAEFLRYGVMHRNTYIDSPRLLDKNFRLKNDSNIYFAGQMTGVEGYVESAASGLFAGISAAVQARGGALPVPPKNTAFGSLALYVSSWASSDFQPMNVNFGIMPPLDVKIRKKADKNILIAKRALDATDEFVKEYQNGEI